MLYKYNYNVLLHIIYNILYITYNILYIICTIYYIIYYIFYPKGCLLGGRVMKRGGRRLPTSTE